MNTNFYLKTPVTMPNVLFVGDRPSKDNVDAKVAFIGTKSYKTLLRWIYVLGLPKNYYKLINSYTDDDKVAIINYNKHGYKIVALGVNASKVLDNLKIKHFVMYHPSGRNRKLNHIENVLNLLDECHNYLFK